MSNVVPEGWEIHKIKDVVNFDDRYSFTGGPFGSDLKSEDYTEQGVRIIQLQNIGDGEFKNKYKIYTSEEKADSLISCNIYPGDIILSKMGDPVARAVIIPAIANRYVMASDGIRLSVDNERYNTKFIHDTINFESFRNQAELNSTGSTRKRIGLTQLRELIFSAPPLSEQKKIAAILTSVDEVIEKTQAQIDKLKALKTAMMQELLTCGVGVDGKPHTEFKDSPVGRIPKGWEVKALEELVKLDRKITYGIVQAGPHYEGGVPYIRVSDMNNRELSANGMLLTSPEIAKKYDRSSVQTGDIVYALRGMIGHVHIVPESLNGANLTQGTARLSINDEINTNYLLWAMRSPYVALQNDLEAKGSTFKEVTLASLRKISVAIPSISEQEDISLTLSAIERKQYFVEDKIIQLKSLKKALMQDLLTGKVRVKVD